MSRSVIAMLVVAGTSVIVHPVLAKTSKPPATNAFLTEAIKGDIGEIQLGQLAQSNATSPDVRAFGQTLVTDHTAARDEMTTVAKQMSVPVPTTAATDAKREMTRLSQLKGAAFDREFVRHMVADHRKDVIEFQRFAKSGQNEATATAQKES